MSSVDYEKAADITSTLEDQLAETLRSAVPVDRRTVLGSLGLLGSAVLTGVGAARGQEKPDDHPEGGPGVVGEYQSGDFDPHNFLNAFNTGTDGQDFVEQDVYQEGGQTVRHFELTAVDTTLEVAPGVEFPVPAWAFNGQVPGPTLRAVEGDLIRITLRNGSEMAHTIHPHLINPDPVMDGVPHTGPGTLETGDEFTYEWTADPAGVHFYHCHSFPLRKHIHRGLYGVIVVDPDPSRVRESPRDYVNYHGPITADYRQRLVEIARSRNHKFSENDDVHEMVMVMNGFDVDFDGDNEVYAANTRAFAYSVGSTDEKGDWTPGETKRPIQIQKDELQRVYLVNATEFDDINSFHPHSQFFDYYDHGTTLFPTRKNIDTVMQCQAQRGILELDYSDHEPGLYMFHAHQSEFAEQGWMSFFEVVED